MRRHALPLLLAAAGVLWAASAWGRSPARAQATRRLTVIEGSGGGDYAPGATVRIEPYRVPDGKTFDRWEGRTLPHPFPLFTAHATFTMPDWDLTVGARWRPAPLWAWEPVEGLTDAAMAHEPRHPLPDGASGFPTVLVLLHDAGQSLDYWRESSEARIFARAAAERGMGLLAVQSTDPGGLWDLAGGDPSSNADLGRVLAAIHGANLRGPLVFLGVGRGAAFADLAARAFLPLSSVQSAGAILVGGAGHVVKPGPHPRFWVLADKDRGDDVAEAARRHEGLLDQRVPTGLVHLAPWPMAPRRFWRVEGLTAADSIQLHALLVTAGVLDGQGSVLRDPAALDVGLLPEDLRAAAPNLLEQLNAGWGGHGFNTHAAERMLEFAWGMAMIVVPNPTPEPTRMAYAGHIEVRGGAAGKGDFGGSEAWYTDRDRVHIWAQPDPPGLVFDHWAGETGAVGDLRARHTALTVHQNLQRLDATFAPAPEWRPARRQVDGREVFLHAPPQPVGLIFFFHGAGGASQGWVRPGNEERWLALRDAVARGYAVAISESGDRQAGQWSPVEPPASNQDILHIQALHARLVAEGAVAAGLPVYGIGMSNGGGFVTRVADALGWQGAVVYDAACRPRIGAQTTVPVAWHLSENDRRVSNQDAFSCHRALARRGVPTELRVLRPQPVHPMRLMRAPGIGPAEAEAIRRALAAAGLLDRIDLQVQPPSTSDWRSALGGVAGVSPAQVAEQLDVAWTEHQFYGDFNHLALDFFDRLRGLAGPPTARPVVTLTPGPTFWPTDEPASATPSATVTERPGGRAYLPRLDGD